MSNASKSRRQRRREAERLRHVAEPMTQQALDVVEEPKGQPERDVTLQDLGILVPTDWAPLRADDVSPAPKRPFVTQKFRLKGGYEVTVKGPTAFEEDIDIDFTRGNTLVITTVEGRVGTWSEKPPAAARVESHPMHTIAQRTANEGESNRHLFERGKTSKIINDPPPYEKEAANSNVEVVITPRAPTDRTSAQKRALGLVSAETSAGPVNVDTGLSLESLRAGT